MNLIATTPFEGDDDDLIAIMSDKRGEVLAIHPVVMQGLGPEWVRAAINVRDRLRDGTLKPPHHSWFGSRWGLPSIVNFDMANPCKCIGHHIGKQFDVPINFTPYMRARYACLDAPGWSREFTQICDGLESLFASGNPSDPVKASNAIEEFLTTARVTKPWP